MADWPGLPDGWTADEKMRRFLTEHVLDAEIELEKGRRSADEPANPTRTMSFALEQKLHESLYTVATGAIDRARTGAQFVQTAASAIGVLYTGVLAVIFVSDTPVPARGFLPTLFFAIAIGLATAYLAFVNKMQPIARPTLYGSVAEDIWQRTNFLARYTRTIVLQRAPLLRAAVIALVFGVILLPAAVFQVPDASSAETAAASPAIDWPDPPPDRPTALAVVLYEHQLDHFVDNLEAGSQPAATSPGEEDILAALITVVGLLLIAFTGMNWIWSDSDADPDGAVVIPPAVDASER